jgi:hypothetical protein
MGFLPTTKYKNNERTVSGSVNVENSDLLLNVDTSLVACTINLQSIPNDNWNTLYKLYVKDISGNAGTNNITIVAPTGYKINNSQTLILNTNNESVLVRISSNVDYVSFPNKAGHIIQDEGNTLPQQPILDFVGTGVTVTNGVGKTIVTINDCCDFVELTNTQMLELISNGTVDAGTYYKITNPINADEGVIVQGIVTNANPSLQGSGIFLNADYQNVGDYSGVSGYAGNLGIWSSVVQTVVAGNVVIWGNRHWRNLAGNWGTALNFTTLDDSWVLLPKNTTNGYIREVDFIKYNVNTNLVIYRADKRLNEVEYQYPILDAISVFQWGRDVVQSNKVFSVSSMQCTNSYCSFTGNHLTNESAMVDISNINSLGYSVNANTLTSNSYLDIRNNTGSIAYNTLNKSSITIITNNGALNDNFLTCNSSINVTNNQGDIAGNNLNTGGIILVDNIGSVINNSLNSGTINVNYNDNSILDNTITTNAGIGIAGANNATIFGNLITNRGSISCASDTFYGNIGDCTIDSQEIFPEYFTIDQLGRIINTGYSNFEIYLSLSSPSVYNAGLETLTIPSPQFGRIYLTNATSNIISKINNLESIRSTKISIYNNAYVETYAIFQHTVIASVSDGDLVCDAPNSAITLVGRYMGSDFIEYQKSIAVGSANYVNLRTNLVKLA